MSDIKVLNLYAGLSGNRKLWEGVEVTSVEIQEDIAELNQKLYPNDIVIVADAHQYLLDHYQGFDFIWSSPPCPSHSKMIRSGRNRKPRYPDMKLYEEIIFLEHNFSHGRYVVENVVPYYLPLLPAQRIGRHLLWSNFHIGHVVCPPIKGLFEKSKQELMDWLNIHYEENICSGDNHDPQQPLRNCVHPDIGKQIFDYAFPTDLFGDSHG